MIEEIAKLLAALGTAAGIGIGGWKVYLNAKRSKDAVPLETYKGLTADLRRELDEVRADRLEDKKQYERRFEELERAAARDRKKITELEGKDRRSQVRITHLRERVKYLTGLLHANAPEVQIDPDPNEEDDKR